MLASLADPPVAQRGLAYEPKYDGIRALIDIQPGAARGKDRGPRIAITRATATTRARSFLRSSALWRRLRDICARRAARREIVATNEGATPLGFQHIQGRIHLSSPADITHAPRGSQPH
jgi:ATP-dependent DNA ligase